MKDTALVVRRAVVRRPLFPCPRSPVSRCVRVRPLGTARGEGSRGSYRENPFLRDSVSREARRTAGVQELRGRECFHGLGSSPRVAFSAESPGCAEATMGSRGGALARPPRLESILQGRALPGLLWASLSPMSGWLAVPPAVIGPGALWSCRHERCGFPSRGRRRQEAAGNWGRDRGGARRGSFGGGHVARGCGTVLGFPPRSRRRVLRRG